MTTRPTQPPGPYSIPRPRVVWGEAANKKPPTPAAPPKTAASDCPAIDAEITVFEKSRGPLTKRITLLDGKVVNDSSACRMANGFARRVRIDIGNMQALADLINNFTPSEAYALGRLKDGLPDRVCVVRADKLNGAGDPSVIARTLEYLIFNEDEPGLVLLDVDLKGISEAAARRMEKCGDLWDALCEVLPALKTVAGVERASTSSGLRNTKTGESFPNSGGRHVVIPVHDVADSPRFLSDLHDRCWLNGFGWGIVSAAGSFLERSIIDKSVGSPERLIFEGRPVLESPLEQLGREAIAHDGHVLDTRLCPPLTDEERAEVQKLIAAEELRLLPERQRKRAEWSITHIQRLVAHGIPEPEARTLVDRWIDRKELTSDFPLPFDDPKLAGTTVAQVLAAPDQYVGKTLSDPFEGPAYGTGKAIIFRRDDGSLFINSFAHGGMVYELTGEKPVGVALNDFFAFMPQHTYLFVPTREPWVAASVNNRIAPLDDGVDDKGEPKTIKASTWLDRNKPVEQMTWAPGEPMLIKDRLVAEGGWFARLGVTCFNLYLPPAIADGDPNKAGPWIDHVRKVYPDDADHIIKYFAQRVQKPQVKINHALFLGGPPGIGKDTLIEPVKRAVGPWNCHEVSPKQMTGRFNGFLKSVLLRISEARDLGDLNRYEFYDHMKAIIAAPPDVLRVDEKNLREHSVLNCCGVVITSNYKDGIYLAPDDRRHFVAWSPLSKEDFAPDYWKQIWKHYETGGDRHVAAYLRTLDLTAFDPKAPPPKTPAFWDIVDVNRAPEDADLADVLDDMGKPEVVTLTSLIARASDRFRCWLEDTKNGRAIPHRLEECGYVKVRNLDAKDGLWRINGKRQTIYARADLALREQLAAAAKLAGR